MKSICIAGFLVALFVCGCQKAPDAGTATLPELNRALAAFALAPGRQIPTDVNELTNFPSLRGKQLPTPPAGMRLVIDPESRQVLFTNISN